MQQYCTGCHNQRRLLGNLVLEDFDVARAAENADIAERMIRKLRAGMMPPPGASRPAGDTLATLAETLEETIDRAAATRPYAGSRSFQRLNRAEYGRVVYDLLGVTVDPAEWLPDDRISGGFDNIADEQTLSPTLMDAYLAAASAVARRAVGDRDAATSSTTYTNPPNVSQHEWERAPGAPFGTRGGISVLHAFPGRRRVRLLDELHVGVGRALRRHRHLGQRGAARAGALRGQHRLPGPQGLPGPHRARAGPRRRAPPDRGVRPQDGRARTRT